VDSPQVLVTGASRGIGRAIAVAFAARGGRIAINFLGNESGARETERLALAAGAAEVLLCQGDVADGPSVQAMAAALEAHWGRLDVVVNNAGYGCPGRLTELDEADWDRTFATHLKGAFHVCRATIPLLARSSAGCIINMSSVAGLRGLPAAIAYGTAKASLIAFTRCLAWELADQNIRVNAVCPGIVRTDFHARMTPETREHNLRHRVPLHREGQPEQIAQTALFIADNEYMTGETVTVDGGLSMRIC